MRLYAGEKIAATYYIKSALEKENLEKDLKVGLTLRVVGKTNEVLKNTIPNTFNYKEYLLHQKIYCSFTISKLEILDEKIDFFSKIKNAMDGRIKNLGDNAYLRAFILGNKNDISNEQYQSIVSNGVSHLFALSGMHLSLVYLLLSKLLNKIKGKKIIIYLFLFLYLFITGFSVSFLRAILFMLLLDVNKLFKINISSIKVLFLTAFVLLLYNPFFIYQVGFWYTFVVTFSLLFCNSFIQKKGKLKQILLVSLITFLFSAPISIYINYEINLVSILNNVVLVPFISSLVFPFALLSFVIPLFLPIFNFFVFLLEKINALCLHFAFFLVIGKINLLEVIIYYIFLLLCIQFRSKRIGFLLLLFITFLYNKNLFNNDYSAYFIDVGQGDSTLFVAPRNKEVILIDTGGEVSYAKKDYQIRNKEFDLSKNIILFLKSIRIRKIDLLLITHGDKDHVGYAKKIGEKIRIKNLMINQGEVNRLEKELISKYSVVYKYQSKMFDFTTYPLKLYNNENDNSIITKIKIKNTDFLLMGDASQEVEKDLLNQYKMKADFLKVGHHGSKTSSSYNFLKQVNPQYAIISAGRNNRYNHPSSETIENLKKIDISILNTQEMGTIQIKINKKGYHIISMLT